MSTLPPKPVFDPNVPIVSSAGGSSAAYKDPNSPESIMRKTATLNAQAVVDSQFDVAQSQREGFLIKCNRDSIQNKYFLSILLLLILVITLFKFVKEGARVFLIGFIILLLLLILQKKHASTRF